LNWNVSNVTDMSHMFRQTLKFDQSLKCWTVSDAVNLDLMFLNSKMATLTNKVLAEKMFIIPYSNNNKIFNDINRTEAIKKLQAGIESKGISEVSIKTKKNMPNSIKPYIFGFLHNEDYVKQYAKSIDRLNSNLQ